MGINAYNIWNNIMKTIFEISGWRDVAFHPFSEDGKGCYIHDKIITEDIDNISKLLRDEYIIISERNTLYFNRINAKIENEVCIISDCIDTFNSYADYKYEEENYEYYEEDYELN